jgi:hypothetical protein
MDCEAEERFLFNFGKPATAVQDPRIKDDATSSLIRLAARWWIAAYLYHALMYFRSTSMEHSLVYWV